MKAKILTFVLSAIIIGIFFLVNRPSSSLIKPFYTFYSEPLYYQTIKLQLQVFQSYHSEKEFQLLKVSNSEIASNLLMSNEASLILTQQPLDNERAMILKGRKLMPLCFPVAMLSDTSFIYAVSAKGATSVETEFTNFMRSERGQLIFKKAGLSPIFVPSRGILIQ